MLPPPMPMLLRRPSPVVGVTASAKPSNFRNYSLLCVGLGSRRSSCTPSSRCFSSNAEQPTSSRRRWWSDESQFPDDEDEFEEEEEGSSFGGSASWDQAFDEPWFTKASKAYGYVLPVILLSLLVATGPQAFLMALAIPLAQSALSLALRAFSSIFGRRADREEYDDDDEYYYSDNRRSSGWGESGYGDDSSSYSTKYKNSSSSGSRQQQPWAEDGKPADSGPVADSDDGTGSASSGNDAIKRGSGSTGFGGWDELDDLDIRSSKRRRGTGPAPATDAAAAGGGAASSVWSRRRPQPETTTARGRRPRSRAASRYRQSPLVVRLLVAVFPFLGSWFRIML